MGYQNKKGIDDINDFVENLPHKIKLELSLYIYEARYSQITFFKNRSASFVSWICPLLKPQLYGQNEYIYYEGDLIENICFVINGKAAFVLPSYRNSRYITINPGDHFGVIDILGSVSQHDEIDLNNWYDKKSLLKRQFTIQAVEDTECLILSLQNYYQMQKEFTEMYDDFISQGTSRLKKAWVIKLDSMKICNYEMERRKKDNENENLSDSFESDSESESEMDMGMGIS